jgi:plasmid stability protein
MARKKAAEKVEKGEMSGETRAVRLDMPLDAHRLLRMAAAEADKSMAAFARDTLSEALAAWAKRKGAKA